MPRPRNTRRTPVLFPSEPAEGQIFEPTEFWANPKGMFASAQPQQVGPDAAVVVKNFEVNENGKYVVRRPLKRNFYDAAVTPIAQLGLNDSTGVGLLLLFHTTGIKYSVDGGSNWLNATGASLGATQMINYAMWSADKLMFTTNNNSGAPEVWQFVISTKTYATIAASPEAQIMTVFGGRVVTSPGGSSHLDWSVNKDNTDWSGAGSGFEDMVLSPGQTADDVIGLFPVNDTQMLIIRSGSVWLCELTGDADAPFQFSFLYKINLAVARTLSYSDRGVYAAGLDNVYLLTTSGPKIIGDAIIGGWFNSDSISTSIQNAVGIYNTMKGIYYVYIPSIDITTLLAYILETDGGDDFITDTGEDLSADYPATNQSLVLAYHEKQDLWTFHSYPINITSMHYADFRSPAVRGLLICTSNNQSFRDYRLDEPLPTDGQEEYDYANVLQTVEAQIVSGTLSQKSNSEDILIGNVEVDLTTGPSASTVRRVLMYLYRARSGPRTLPADAVTYSDKTNLVDASGRVFHVIRKNQLTSSFYQLDVRLSKCPGYILNSVKVYSTRGSLIAP